MFGANVPRPPAPIMIIGAGGRGVNILCQAVTICNNVMSSTGTKSGKLQHLAGSGRSFTIYSAINSDRNLVAQKERAAPGRAALLLSQELNLAPGIHHPVRQGMHGPVNLRVRVSIFGVVSRTKPDVESNCASVGSCRDAKKATTSQDGISKRVPGCRVSLAPLVYSRVSGCSVSHSCSCATYPPMRVGSDTTACECLRHIKGSLHVRGVFHVEHSVCRCLRPV